MKKSLVFLLCALILLPLVFLFFMAFRMVTQERFYVEEKIKILLGTRLEDIRERIAGFTLQVSRGLDDFKNMKFTDPWDIRQQIRGRRMVRQLFILDREGQFLHPPPEELRTEDEQLFFRRTESIWLMGETFYKGWKNDYDRVETSGWYPWYWGDGVNLIYWMWGETGLVIGIEINKTALMADIIGKLPDSPEDENRIQEGRVVLSDLSGKVIYQWGPYTPRENEEPLVQVPVDFPLNSWTLSYYMDTQELSLYQGRSSLLSLVTGAGVLVLLLVFMGIYIYRESSREIREASRRVSFVNQVSHELKTPLTNIRMYAELLEGRSTGGDARARSYLKVIVSESHRLTRLIQNVLSFARQERGEEILRKQPGVPDEIIREVLAQFTQSLEKQGLKAEFRGGASNEVSIDPDLLKQILGNLLSNVEKYAASGKKVFISSKLEGGRLSVLVRDQGPGIPSNWTKKIFQPFSRVSNRLSDGVTGTGLGLTISRRLARLHGGELILTNTSPGAEFCFWLETG